MSQATKLGLKPGVVAALDHPPEGWALDQDVDGVRWQRDAAALVDVLIAFFPSVADLVDRLPALERRIVPAGALWVAWPRKAAGHVSDLGDAVVRATVLERGLVDTKVAAIDEDWSALKFVWRLENRARRS